MDRNGVDVAIVRAMGAELAVHNREGNERVLRAGARIRGLATASPWARGAIEELKRSREMGAAGLYLHPTRQGFMPTDEIVEPLLDVAAEARWPVVVHTGTYIQSDVLALAEVARRRRELTFVADGAGFTDMWFELPGVMEEVANLALCGSFIWARAIGNAIKRFGVSRLMFGSGMPRDSLAAALKRFERLEMSEEDRRAFMGDNARRIFGAS